MRITEVLVHKITIAAPPIRSSYGLHQPYALRTVLELKRDDEAEMRKYVDPNWRRMLPRW